MEILRFQKKLVALQVIVRLGFVVMEIVEVDGVKVKLALVASQSTRISWVKVAASQVPVVMTREPVTVNPPVEVRVATAAALTNSRLL